MVRAPLEPCELLRRTHPSTFKTDANISDSEADARS